MGLDVGRVGLDNSFKSLPLFTDFLVIRKFAFVILSDKFVKYINQALDILFARLVYFLFPIQHSNWYQFFTDFDELLS
jgi:hypothetical protein